MRKKLDKSTNAREVYGPLGLVAVVAVVFAVAFGWSNTVAARSASGFVQNASIGNQFEIQSSQLALEKSQNDDIRQFAQRMIDDHTKAAQDLNSAVASARDPDVPAPDTQLDRKHQNLLDKLNQASGSDFDKQYVKDQVKAHHEAVSLFREYANHGDNPSLKNFASQTLPTLESHQQDIRRINSSI